MKSLLRPSLFLSRRILITKDLQIERMENLPDDLLVNEILGRLTVPEILEKCSVDTRFARICQNEQLWNLLTRRDFPHEVEFNSGIPWRTYYFEVKESPILPIYFYEDPIEWVRLTPYNIKKVIRLIQSLIQRLDLVGYSIVFIDNYASPLASVVEGQFNVINANLAMQKIVLLRPGREISEFSVVSELTSMNPQSEKPFPISGIPFTDGSFYLALSPPGRFEIPGRSCVAYQKPFLMRIMQYLNLNDEITRSEGILNRDEICHLIYERLRSMGRILDEVAPPTKPLLE